MENNEIMASTSVRKKQGVDEGTFIATERNSSSQSMKVHFIENVLIIYLILQT